MMPLRTFRALAVCALAFACLVSSVASTCSTSPDIGAPVAFARPPSWGSPARGGGGPLGGGRDRGIASAVATSVVKSNVSGAVDAATGADGGGGLTWKEIVFDVLALLAVLASGLALAVERSAVVVFVGALASTLGPAAAVLQSKIQDMETMRELTNDMREDVNKMAKENKRLRKENVRLDASAKKLEKSKNALAEIGKAQGMSVDTLVQQVTEYKQVQAQMKANLRAKVKQNLLSAVISSDTDMDFFIDPEEVDALVMRLSNMPGVQFNEAAFRKALKKSGMSITDFSKKYLEDASLEKDKIFTY